jgi:hypothetical protein
MLDKRDLEADGLRAVAPDLNLGYSLTLTS